MALLAAACMVVLAVQGTVLGVALLWFAFSGFQNGEYATLSAAIPDHVPVRQRATVADFGWAWLTRFLASLAIAMGTLYLLYFLRDAVHYARLFPGQTAADGLLILILIYTGCVVVTSIVGGVISDRSGRRKMLVTVSGLLMAAAALLLTSRSGRVPGRAPPPRCGSRRPACPGDG
jgi:hypothetical protein